LSPPCKTDIALYEVAPPIG